MKIDLLEAPIAEKETLANLLELYEYDFSDFDGKDVDEKGKYGYKYLDLYWVEPNRHPFLMKVDEKLAGFVLVNLNDPEAKEENIHSIAEFFVLRKYRGKGIGEEAAIKIFDRFPGKWNVRQLTENKAAQAFWKKVIDRYSKGSFKETAGEKGPCFVFTN